MICIALGSEFCLLLKYRRVASMVFDAKIKQFLCDAKQKKVW